MNKQLTIVAFVIISLVLVIAAYAFVKSSSQEDSMMKIDESMMIDESTSPNPGSEIMKNDVTTMNGEGTMNDKMSGSRYVQYNKSVLDETSNTRRVLFFYASWCPTCKPADASFTQNISKIPEDVTVIRVNYNDPETDQEEKELAKKYGVTYQHTFVQIDGSGKEVTKWNGGQIEELLSKLK